jgi:hypothetical protein
MKRSREEEDALYIATLESLVWALSEYVDDRMEIAFCEEQGCERTCEKEGDEDAVFCNSCGNCSHRGERCVLHFPEPYPECSICHKPFCPNCALGDGTGRCVQCEE